jgi:hypothetical protein
MGSIEDPLCQKCKCEHSPIFSWHEFKNDKIRTVGYKFRYNGVQYGSYVVGDVDSLDQMRDELLLRLAHDITRASEGSK